MRLLHLADLHIGKQLNGFSLLNDQKFALEGILRTAEREGVDVLVLSGDLYDRAAPASDAVALLDWFLTAAASQGLAVVAVPGNHDSAERVGYASRLLARQNVHVPRQFDGTLEHVEIPDEHGSVTFWLMPFLRPAQVRPFFPDAEIGGDYTAALRAVIEAAPVDPAKRNVLVAHQFVTSGGAEPERSDSELTIGGVDNVDASVFEAFDYVALGHIHRAQRIGRDAVRYAGSLLKYSTSEADNRKTAALVELGAKPLSEQAGTVSGEAAANSEDDGAGVCGEADESRGEAGADGSLPSWITVKLVPIEPLHDLREIRGPVAALTDPATVGAADAEDYVHATVTDAQPPLDVIRMLRAAYPNLIALDFDSASAQADAGSASPEADAAPDRLDPEALFAQFFERQNGRPLSDEQAEATADALARAQQAEGGVA